MRREHSEADRRESRLVSAVVAEGFVNRLGFGIVTFALPLYALELGMSIAEIGLLVSAKAVLQPAVKPLVGWAVDRWGTRKGYLAAVGFRFLAAVALLLAATPAALFGVRLLQGLASAASDPVSISVLAKGRGERTARRFSAVYAARDIGKVAAGAVAGGLLALTGSFTPLWVVVVVLAAIPLWVVWGFVHELPDRPTAAPVDDLPQEAERILRSPRLRAIAALGLLGGLTATMTHALFQVYAAEVAGLSAGQIGLVYSLSVGALLVVGPLAGWAGDRYGHSTLASVRGAANGVSSLVYLFAPTFAGMLAGRLVDEGGKAAFRPTWGSLLASASRRARDRGGRTVAGLDAWLSVGEALGPVLAGLLWDFAGVIWFLVVRAVLGVGTELVLGRRLRALLKEPAAVVSSRVPLRPGAGRLELRGLQVDDDDDPVHLLAGPGVPVRVRGDARRLQALLAGRAPAGTALLDGQDLARVAADGPWPVSAVLPAASPPPGTTVAAALAAAWPAAAPEDHALAWRRAGLADALPLPAALQRQVQALGGGHRERLRLALGLLGSPVVLVVDRTSSLGDPQVRELLDGLVVRHPGAVVEVEPRTGPRPQQEVEGRRLSSHATL